MREAKSEDRAWELLRQLREEHAGTAITTDQFLDAWLAEPGRRPKTQRAYSFAIGLVRGSLAGIPLKELRVQDVQKALDFRRKNGSAYSANGQNTSTFLAWITGEPCPWCGGEVKDEPDKPPARALVLRLAGVEKKMANLLAFKEKTAIPNRT
jgi:hypothetical protein